MVLTPSSVRRGRPTIEQVTGDPLIGQKAVELRRAGQSWREVADELEISRTTARRLCQKSEDGSHKAQGQESEEANFGTG